MRGAGPTRDPLNAGVPGGPGSNVPAGSAEVHSRVTHGGEAGIGGGSSSERPLGSGTQGGGGRGGTGGGEQSLAERGMERAREMADQASEQARELGDRATETASRARHQAAAALDQAEDVLEERTGLISTIRQNPLPALGIAFGFGFMLAGSDSGSRRRKGGSGRGGMQRTMDQAKSAVMGAISAAAAQQIRSLLAGLTGQHGSTTHTGGAAGTTAGRGPARH